MEVKTLDKISGAWAEKSQASFLRLAVKAEYDFSQVSSRIRKSIITGLRTGVIGTTSGKSCAVYRVICSAFGLKYVCASKTGRRLYTNFNDEKFFAACKALNSLTSAGSSPHSYMHMYQESIVCWAWDAKDEATRNIFSETIGYADKEVREDAIDFLCSGGKLEQTWIDHNPI